MNISEIKISESIESASSLGLRRWNKFEATASLTPDEDKEQAVKQLREFVQKNIFPDEGMKREFMGDSSTTKGIENSKEMFVAAMITEIEQATEISNINKFNKETGLLAYESAANSDPRIKASYDFKFQQLKNK